MWWVLLLGLSVGCMVGLFVGCWCCQVVADAEYEASRSSVVVRRRVYDWANEGRVVTLARASRNEP